jgi:uncharacterized membrane protein YphA (DoxX/SURF4 family)
MKWMKLIRVISRYIVGIVFVFSGFSKGVDPLGTVYQFEDYMTAYGTQWALPLALPITVILCTIEFTIGIALLLNFKMKIIRWALLGIMIFFTILTLVDAIFNMVTDCGCFGEAILLTNWQTFYKNLVLMVFALIIFFTQKYSLSTFSTRTQNIIAVVTMLLFSTFTVYSYNRLPIIDFLGWDVGRDLVPEDPGKPVTYLIYKNKLTGETRKMLSGDLPWQDSVWMSQWEFSDTEIDDSQVKKSHGLKIQDSTGMDVTDFYIANPGYQFILVAYDIDKANTKGMDKMVRFCDEATHHDVSFILLTASLPEVAENYREQKRASFEIFYADDIILKMMTRSNPGLILLHNGIIMDKWHFHHFPEYKEIKEQITTN